MNVKHNRRIGKSLSHFGMSTFASLAGCRFNVLAQGATTQQLLSFVCFLLLNIAVSSIKFKLPKPMFLIFEFFSVISNFISPNEHQTILLSSRVNTSCNEDKYILKALTL